MACRPTSGPKVHNFENESGDHGSLSLHTQTLPEARKTSKQAGLDSAAARSLRAVTPRCRPFNAALPTSVRGRNSTRSTASSFSSTADRHTGFDVSSFATSSELKRTVARPPATSARKRSSAQEEAALSILFPATGFQTARTRTLKELVSGEHTDGGTRAQTRTASTAVATNTRGRVVATKPSTGERTGSAARRTSWSELYTPMAPDSMTSAKENKESPARSAAVRRSTPAVNADSSNTAGVEAMRHEGDREQTKLKPPGQVPFPFFEP